MLIKPRNKIPSGRSKKEIEKENKRTKEPKNRWQTNTNYEPQDMANENQGVAGPRCEKLCETR
jgi:hypothetical protein